MCYYDKTGFCSDYHLKKLIGNVFPVYKLDKHYDIQHFIFSDSQPHKFLC